MEIWWLAPLYRHFPEWWGKGSIYTWENLHVRKNHEQNLRTRWAHFLKIDGEVRQRFGQKHDTSTDKLGFHRIFRNVFDHSSSLFLLPQVAEEILETGDYNTVCIEWPWAKFVKAKFGSSDRPTPPRSAFLQRSIVCIIRPASLLFRTGSRVYYPSFCPRDIRIQHGNRPSKTKKKIRDTPWARKEHR